MKHFLPSALLVFASMGTGLHAAQSDPTALGSQEALREAPTLETRAMPEVGPFTVGTVSLSASQTPGFGGADIFTPQNSEGQRFPALTMIPGYVCPRKTIAWLAPLVASHGFVVMVMDARTIFDQPSQRSAAMMKALSFLTDASPAKDLVDPDRMAIWGHSMGGGATLETASKMPNLKAAIAVAPYDNIKSFPGITLPTLVITSSFDFIAPASAHGKPMYNSLSGTTEKSYQMISAGHMAATMKDSRIAQLTLDWLKRYVEQGFSVRSGNETEGLEPSHE